MKIKEKVVGKKMTVKKIDKGDYKEVIELIKSEFPYVEFDEGKIRERIESNKIFLFKAVEGKKILGFVELEILEGNIARINGLTVKPESRNKGVAKELLDYAIKFLKEKKIARILLLVKEKNAAAKKIYKEAGFSFIGMYHRELDQAVVEEMELDLGSEDKENLSYVG